MLERLQKILSTRGIASRRKAEEYIRAGLVKVNGTIAMIGDKADPSIDVIEVDGAVLEDRRKMLYYLLHKPVGVVTSNVERWEQGKGPMTEGRKRALKRKGEGAPVPQPLRDRTVRDLLPPDLQGKIYPVGRLDKDSGGLLLLTNDGPLAHRLTHPSFEHEKEYEVLVSASIADEALTKMEGGGMIIDGAPIKPARVNRLDHDRFRIVLTEGRNRQIRRMCEKLGAHVQALTRVRIMTLADPALKPGEIRPLTDVEKNKLLTSVGLAKS